MSERIEDKSADQALVLVAFIGTALIGFWLSWWLWPSGLLDLPIASLTLGGLLRAALSAMSASVTVLILWCLWAFA